MVTPSRHLLVLIMPACLWVGACAHRQQQPTVVPTPPDYVVDSVGVRLDSIMFPVLLRWLRNVERVTIAVKRSALGRLINDGGLVGPAMVEPRKLIERRLASLEAFNIQVVDDSAGEHCNPGAPHDITQPVRTPLPGCPPSLLAVAHIGVPFDFAHRNGRRDVIVFVATLGPGGSLLQTYQVQFTDVAGTWQITSWSIIATVE